MLFLVKEYRFHFQQDPAKAFTPPAESKMGTKPGRAVTREFIEGGVYSLISVLPNNSFLNQLLLGYLPRHFTSKTLLAHLM